jgi:hypothetical protein
MSLLLIHLPIVSAGVTSIDFRVVDLNFELEDPVYSSLTRVSGISRGAAVGIVADAGPRHYTPSAVLWAAHSNIHALLPSPGPSAEATAIWNDQIVGHTRIAYDEPFGHALLWSGAQHQVTDLHPSGFTASSANGVAGDQQVGVGATDDQWHALLWEGSADSMIDLGGGSSFLTAANAIDGNRQGGMFNGHAALWSGSAGSMIDLNPNGYERSEVLAMSKGRQVGYAGDRAMVWSGSAASATALNPGAFEQTRATGVAGSLIVGFGSTATYSDRRALLWVDEFADPVDLELFLPQSLRGNYSAAWSIDPGTGMIAGEAAGHAVLWVPQEAALVPLPAAIYSGTVGLIICAIPHAAARWRRPRR